MYDDVHIEKSKVCLQYSVKPSTLEHFFVNFDEEWFARQEVFCGLGATHHFGDKNERI